MKKLHAYKSKNPTARDPYHGDGREDQNKAQPRRDGHCALLGIGPSKGGLRCYTSGGSFVGGLKEEDLVLIVEGYPYIK